MQAIARFLSFVFHPLFLPTYAILMLLWVSPAYFGPLSTSPAFLQTDSFFILRTVLMYSVLYPLFVLVLMKLLGFVDSYEVQDLKQRIVVYIATSFFFTWTYIVFVKSAYPNVLSDIMLGATALLCIAIFFGMLRDKISVHAMGMGAILAIALFVAAKYADYDMTYIIYAVVLIGGLVSSSRLLLKAHQPVEVYNGYLTGFLVQALILIF